MSRAKGPPCVVCREPVPVRAVTRCPWCRAVLCLKCICPNRCATPTWGLKRADGRGRVVHIATTSQAKHEDWASRMATTRCGQSGYWVHADEFSGPACVKCNSAPPSPPPGAATQDKEADNG